MDVNSSRAINSALRLKEKRMSPHDMPRFDAAPPKGVADDTSSTVSAIRKANLLWLRSWFQDEMLRRFPNEPERGMDKLFAERIGLNPKYFGHIKNDRRNVGNALARQVEAAFQLKVGWMDHPHRESKGADKEQIVSALLELLQEKPDLMRALRKQMGKKF